MKGHLQDSLESNRSNLGLGGMQTHVQNMGPELLLNLGDVQVDTKVQRSGFSWEKGSENSNQSLMKEKQSTTLALWVWERNSNLFLFPSSATELVPRSP